MAYSPHDQGEKLLHALQTLAAAGAEEHFVRYQGR